jgi:hypothetical protein
MLDTNNCENYSKKIISLPKSKSMTQSVQLHTTACTHNWGTIKPDQFKRVRILNKRLIVSLAWAQDTLKTFCSFLNVELIITPLVKIKCSNVRQIKWNFGQMKYCPIVDQTIAKMCSIEKRQDLSNESFLSLINWTLNAVFSFHCSKKNQSYKIMLYL